MESYGSEFLELKGLSDEIYPVRATEEGKDSGVRERSRGHHREVSKTRGGGGLMLLTAMWMGLTETDLGPVSWSRAFGTGGVGEGHPVPSLCWLGICPPPLTPAQSDPPTPTLLG